MKSVFGNVFYRALISASQLSTIKSDGVHSGFHSLIMLRAVTMVLLSSNWQAKTATIQHNLYWSWHRWRTVAQHILLCDMLHQADTILLHNDLGDSSATLIDKQIVTHIFRYCWNHQQHYLLGQEQNGSGLPGFLASTPQCFPEGSPGRTLTWGISSVWSTLCCRCPAG